MTFPLFRLLCLLVLIVSSTGCNSEHSRADQSGKSQKGGETAAERFNPANCGSVVGRVTWNGELPVVPTFLYGMPRKEGGFKTEMMPNPNRSNIDAASRHVAQAVVFLRGVNAAAGKPWDLPPVRVEMSQRQIVVHQGAGEPRRVGFVRRGDAIAMVSTEPESVFHVLRGRGAAFFSLAFPDADRPLTRILDQIGRVELSSGSGYYWARADLFVDDHPYYTLTDGAGRFRFDQVPAGNFEVVAYMPGCMPAKQERDPESGSISRQTYSPPLEVKKEIRLSVGGTVEVQLAVP